MFMFRSAISVAWRMTQVDAGYDDPDKSSLFFKLHQLQTGSWGISRIGRITQVG